MAINYSVGQACNFSGNDEQKLYARVQSTQTVSLEEIAKYAASHYGGMVDKMMVMKVVDMLSKSVVDKLKDGCRVSLGDLGTYYAHIKSTGKSVAEIREEGFHPSRDIEDVCVKWSQSQLMKHEINVDNVTFKQVSQLDTKRGAIKESEGPAD
ncbi:MAG: hypothetical protein Q4F34_03480 [Prevotellaceae bacterium]|nr:hypothetical protein [Prevotellaceae bacterium]